MTEFVEVVTLDFGRYVLYVLPIDDPFLVWLFHVADTLYTLFLLGELSRHPIIEGLKWIYAAFIPGGWLFRLSLILGGLCFIAVLLFLEQCFLEDVKL